MASVISALVKESQKARGSSAMFETAPLCTLVVRLADRLCAPRYVGGGGSIRLGRWNPSGGHIFGRRVHRRRKEGVVCRVREGAMA
jgi:hypothetical protein